MQFCRLAGCGTGRQSTEMAMKLERNMQAQRRSGKVQVARRLRKETTMNWHWIAASLAMGAAGYAAACVRELLNQS